MNTSCGATRHEGLLEIKLTGPIAPPAAPNLASMASHYTTLPCCHTRACTAETYSRINGLVTLFTGYVVKGWHLGLAIGASPLAPIYILLSS